MEEIKYNGKFVQVKEALIEGAIFEKVYLPHSLVVIALTNENEILFIKEKRPHETPPERLKLVTGHIDPGEAPIDCANRELQEEAGYKAAHLEEIMVHRSTGTLNSNFHYFFAKDLTESKLPNPDGEDTILEIVKVPLKDIERMLYEDKLPWTLSTLGLFKVLKKLT